MRAAMASTGLLFKRSAPDNLGARQRVRSRAKLCGRKTWKARRKDDKHFGARNKSERKTRPRTEPSWAKALRKALTKAKKEAGNEERPSFRKERPLAAGSRPVSLGVYFSQLFSFTPQPIRLFFSVCLSPLALSAGNVRVRRRSSALFPCARRRGRSANRRPCCLADDRMQGGTHNANITRAPVHTRTHPFGQYIPGGLVVEPGPEIKSSGCSAGPGR